MIDDSCEVPREDLDDGFNPCRKQVVENGELCQYAHMYDVMNERYDREEDTSYLNGVKRDKITSSTPTSNAYSQTSLYAHQANGVEGKMDVLNTSGMGNPVNHTEENIPSAKAVADYVSSRYIPVESTRIPPDSDLNVYKTSGNYAVESNTVVPSIINKPVNLTTAFNVYVFPVLSSDYYIGQQLSTFDGAATYYRYYDGGSKQWSAWTLLYPTPASTVPNPLPVDQGGTGAQTRSLKTAAGLTLLPVIDSIGASGALNGYTSVTNIATFITTNNIRPEITAAFENHTADAVANNDLLPTNALMMDYVDGNLINYNGITVSGGGTSNIIYNRVRLKNNRIYGDCDFTVNSEGDDGGVKVNIIINGTDIGIPPVFTKFILSNKPLLVHKSSNTIIEGKNIYNVSNGKVIVQFNIGDFNTGEFIFIVDSVFTGYNQPM